MGRVIGYQRAVSSDQFFGDIFAGIYCNRIEPQRGHAREGSAKGIMEIRAVDAAPARRFPNGREASRCADSDKREPHRHWIIEVGEAAWHTIR